ncbi:TlpA family protein disulfide reductase [Rhodoferax mekongensis]|uniref:TlpA family protein disulfide reductase n=1 Tax=Rhodoferax mekongensis TaxID=3068341 RepID=UPI0028BE6B00|nr:redoxin domain-containing protein [Rhodoferax sp. TBRC 17199]MDT7514500.1 redoxin domain-containing protein [Rhodoferax sp. TBRC 17199]
MRSTLSLRFSRIARTWLALTAWCMGSVSSAWAQVPASTIAVGAPFAMGSAYANGQRFNTGTIDGTVTVAFFWNSNCAVCRDSLPELRANLAGWKTKPFSLLLVNLDRKADDWLAYEKLVGQTQMNAKGLLSVRMDSELPAGVRLPLTLLIDSKGKVLKRFEGRLAPEVWDSVADLLP